LLKNDCLMKELLLSKALNVSTITFLVTSIFISVLYSPSFWYFVDFTKTLYRVVCTQTTLEENKECHSVR